MANEERVAGRGAGSADSSVAAEAGGGGCHDPRKLQWAHLCPVAGAHSAARNNVDAAGFLWLSPAGASGRLPWCGIPCALGLRACAPGARPPA